jgi:hypothetical protein
MMIYIFNTELDIDECTNRLNNSTKHSKFLSNRLSIRASGELFGKVSKNKFLLLKTKKYNFMNPTRIFYGSLSTVENGTSIKGKFRYAISEIFFETLTFALIVMFCWIITFAYISGTHLNSEGIVSDVVVLIIPYVTLISFIIFERISFSKRKTNEEFVLRFIKITLNVK